MRRDRQATPAGRGAGAGPGAGPSAAADAGRLVFGLGARNNRLKHAEYAERRREPPTPQKTAASSALPAAGPQPAPQQVPPMSPAPGSRPAGSKQATLRQAGLKPAVSSQDGPERPAADQPAAQQESTNQESKNQDNPDQHNPDQHNPDQHNPDQHNPDQHNPDRHNPDRHNPDRHNTKQPRPASPGRATTPTQPEATPRTQFNIPPPRPHTLARPGASSIVSYAKARIYERPAPQTPAAPASRPLRLEERQPLPKAITSGFKPPKQQVNVRQARQRWEGGEPFARSKSSRRLAAGKKQLLQSWSTSSVVATQRLHLQHAAQALAAGAGPGASGDPSMKLLARGSVLERVQQFERAPGAAKLEGEPDEAELELSLQLGATSGPREAPAEQRAAKARPLAGPGQRRRSLSAVRRRSSVSGAGPAPNAIPRFHHPQGKPANTYEQELEKKAIAACFDKLPERRASLLAGRRHFGPLAKACKLAEYLREPLHLYVRHLLCDSRFLAAAGSAPASSKAAASGGGGGGQAAAKGLTRAASVDNSQLELVSKQTYVTCDQFLQCWRQLSGRCHDQASRLVHLLTLGQREYLLEEDLVPLVQAVVDDHPGLGFLRAAPDFHMRYIQTVIARIFFALNRSWSGRLSVGELRRGDLLEALERLGQSADINQAADYFSYEHFYVIYCKFWTLDQDHDLLISSEDLARHNEAAISARVIERLFTPNVVARQLAVAGPAGQQRPQLTYCDFVHFLLAEEDKKQPRSVEYWFRVLDLDGDGFISLYEMDHFYQEQRRRLELMGIEALPFADCACQLFDLINPAQPSKVSLRDLKRTKLAAIFLDTFVNVEKYLEHESREFVSTRDLQQDGRPVSDWERYAQEEYEALVSEESKV